MFDAAECMFLYLESSLRVGGDTEGIEIDLPVQREAATGYPLLPASSLKGALRSRARVAASSRSSCWGCSGPPPDSEEHRAHTQQRRRLRFHPASVPGPVVDRPVRLGHQRRDLVSFPRDMAGLRREGRTATATARAATPKQRAWLPRRRCCAASKRWSSRSSRSRSGPPRKFGALGAWMAENAFPDDSVFDFWRSRARAVWWCCPKGPIVTS